MLHPDIGRLITKYRLERGMQPSDLAAATCMSRGTVTDLEHGKLVGVLKFYDVAEALGLRMETLLGRDHLGDAGLGMVLLDKESGESLIWAKQLYEWTAEDVRMLSLVHYRGLQPKTPMDWWFVFTAIQRIALI